MLLCSEEEQSKTVGPGTGQAYVARGAQEVPSSHSSGPPHVR